MLLTVTGAASQCKYRTNEWPLTGPMGEAPRLGSGASTEVTSPEVSAQHRPHVSWVVDSQRSSWKDQLVLFGSTFSLWACGWVCTRCRFTFGHSVQRHNGGHACVRSCWHASLRSWSEFGEQRLAWSTWELHEEFPQREGTAVSPARSAGSLPECHGQRAVSAHGAGRGLLGGHVDRCWPGQGLSACELGIREAQGSLADLTRVLRCPVG